MQGLATAVFRRHDLGHGHAAVHFDALNRGHHQGSVRQLRQELTEDLTVAVRRHHHDHAVRTGDRRRQVAGHLERFRKGVIGLVPFVLPVPGEIGDVVRVPVPERDLDVFTRQHQRQGRAPAAGADHGNPVNLHTLPPLHCFRRRRPLRGPAWTGRPRSHPLPG